LKQAIQTVKNYWLSDISFINLLIMLVFMVFIMPILIESGTVSILFLNMFFLLLYFTGIFSSKEKWVTYISVALFSAHLIMQFIRFDDTPNEFYLVERIVGLFNMSLFIFVNIKLLFRNEQRNVYKIIGALNVYLLFALTGAFAFEILNIHTGRSIAGKITIHHDDTDYATYVYYSLVSLTTVGYDDIYPDGMAARMLSVMLSAAGILYPAVVISRLISGKN
jgi:hypothetical protein